MSNNFQFNCRKLSVSKWKLSDTISQLPVSGLEVVGQLA